MTGPSVVDSESEQAVRPAGRFRIYIGSAAGVGKTCAMLDEGWRRHERGTDVVIGFVETHGRPRTAELVRDLPVVPRKTVDHRGATFTETDLDAVLSRQPEVALIDELAHTNVPGSGAHEKRWQDVLTLFDAGIAVISTVNIQHLESLADAVEVITGVRIRERVPDWVVRADQLELIDSSADQLRRRMLHGNIYPAEKVPDALNGFFRTQNLVALRELALRFVADETEEELLGFLETHRPPGVWDTTERILVAVTQAPGSDAVVRRAARMARRIKGELIVLHVRDAERDGLASDAALKALHTVTEDVGGTWIEVEGEDPARTVVSAAAAHQVTQIVVGATKRTRWDEVVRGSVARKILRFAADAGIDVHVIARRDLAEQNERVTPSCAAAGTEEEARRRVDALVDDLLADLPPGSTAPGAFLAAQFDRGLAWVHHPEGRGGLGLSPSLHQHVTARLRDAGAPVAMLRNLIGYGMVAPTLLAHGTEGQKDRFLRPLFTGEEVWCQLFSEPGAGSDLASLATRAERDGGEWVVTGQKVWTTVAHVSRRGLLLARTDPDVPKHSGLTAFLVAMDGPGVEVRPLYQITGEAEFNEVFFTEARVPDADRLGAVGEGWHVALTTLMNERVAIGGNVGQRACGPIAHALALWRERWQGDRSPHALALRDALVRRWVAHEVARLTNLRAAHNRQAGTPGPEGSVAKLAYAEDNKRTYELCVDLLGAEGMLYGNDYPRVRPTAFSLSADVRRSFLRARANSIEGGTSEVMRNIAGERVLGLPGEPRTDRDVPWKDVARS